MSKEYSSVSVSSFGEGVVDVEGFIITDPSGTSIRQTMVIGDANLSGNVAAVSDASGLYVQIINTESQPLYTSAIGGGASVSVTNFPATQGVSGTISIQEPLSVDDNGGSLTVDGSVSINSLPNVSGTVAISNFPPTQAVSGTVTIQEPLSIDDNGGSITVDGSVNVGTLPNVSGTVSVDNFPGSQTVDGTVSVDNFPSTQAVSGTVTIQEPLSIDDNGGSLTVDGTVSVDSLPNVSGTVTVVDGGGTVSIDDNGGSITVDGTVAATQSGAWIATIQDGGNVISVDDAGGSLTIDGSVNVDALPNVSGTVTVVDGGNTISIDDGGGSITVDGTVSIQEPLSIDDNGGSITVDGTVAATQSGSWNVTVDDQSPVSGTVSVDNFPASQTVDGTVTVQDGGNVISVDDAGGSLTVDGTVTVTDGGGTISVDDGGGTLTVDINNWPVQENVNLEDLNGTTVAVNTGNASNGTLRVVLADDQPYPADLSSISVSATVGANTQILAAPGASKAYVLWGFELMAFGGSTTRPFAITDGNYVNTNNGQTNNLVLGLIRSIPTTIATSFTRGRQCTTNTAIKCTIAGTAAYVLIGCLYVTTVDV